MKSLKSLSCSFMRFISGTSNSNISEIHNEEVYDALTPEIITDGKLEEYFKALDFAFSRKAVRNIAITGPYGAGKSTVILSYLNSRHKKDFINVSLADFSISGKKDEKPPENAEIEFSILQQILYRENKDNLPDSRVDRIQSRDFKHIISVFLATASIIFPIFLFCLSVFPGEILSHFNASNSVIYFVRNSYPERLWCSLFLGFLSLFMVVRVASKAGLFDKKLKLSKIAFLQASAEMASQETSSLLNNCLDEIVYFFSRSKNKIVVFEDLDRLGNTEVFVKLREINQIVNNNLNKDPVRFIYACRDDIFLGSDIRTKFFDFILPIVPVLDARNAYTHLKNKLNSFPAKDDVLLKQTSLYISDMRSLRNIANEFNLFRKIVDENKNEAKVFAIIYYKNLYALDYNLTDKKKGVLYSYINDYRLKSLHSEHFEKLKESITLLNDKLERLRGELAVSADDVRLEKITKYISKELWNHIYFSKGINGRGYDVISLPKDLYDDEEAFINFFENCTQVYIGYDQQYGGFRGIKIDVSNILEDYRSRAELVSTDRLQQVKLISAELHIAKEKYRVRSSITLADLTTIIGEKKFREIAESYIQDCNEPDFLDEKQFKTFCAGFRRDGLESLYYLITNGYIMQDYMRFRSIFHEGTISINDNDYIKAVGRFSGCKEVNDNFSLDDVEAVLSELVDQNFIYRAGAIHHQIIAYMIDVHNDENDYYLGGVISKIFEGDVSEIFSIYETLHLKLNDATHFSQFIYLSLEKHKYLDRMLILLDMRDSDQLKTEIIINMVSLVAPDISTDRERYRKFIERQGYQLLSHLDDETFQPFMDNINELDVVYDDITLPETEIEHEVLRFIADNEMYHFNKSNFRTVVAGLITDVKVTCESVDSLPLTLVAAYELSNVKSTIEIYANLFAQEIFINSEEESDAIVSMLLFPSLSSEMKVEILEKMQFTVTDLSMLQEDVDVEAEEFSWHDLFFRYDHVKPGWTSLLAYMYEECNMSVLTGYIEKHAIALSSQHIALTDGDKYEILYRKIICNDKLSNPAFAAVLTSLYINAEYWDEDLSFSNFRRIVENKRISLSPDTFKKAAGLFSALTDDPECKTLLLWFTQYKDEFLRDTHFYLQTDVDDAFLEELLIDLCRSAEFSLKEKSTLLINHREDYSEQFLDSLKPSSDVIKETIKLSSDDSHKISLIIRLLTYKDINRADIKDMVSELNEAEYRKLFSQQTATLTLSNNSEAESFMSALQEHGLIDGWKPRDDGKYSVECRKKSRKEADDR